MSGRSDVSVGAVAYVAQLSWSALLHFNPSALEMDI